MELSLSGNALKTFHRSITCLARVGTELVLQSSPSQLTFHTINSSRSAYQSVTLKPSFFDAYALSAPPPVQCSLLLKAVCSIFRTPVAGVDRLSVLLPSPDASKVQFVLECFNGMRKTYWITCNVEPDIQQLSLEKGRFRSSLVVRPRDLSRLLSNFQSSLQEITVIATEPSTLPSDDGGGIEGKAVELRSYIDPAKDNSDATLHTQLWIDPAEEFLQYTHVGDPVDVTFSMKELKAFLSFCEGCEVDIHLYFEKAGEPILLAPKFGLDDDSISDFDATLVLATMLTSQLREGSNSQIPTSAPAPDVRVSVPQPELARAAILTPLSDHASEHTRIWSELSASNASREREAQLRNQNCGPQNPTEGPNTTNSKEQERRNNLDISHQPMDVDRQDRVEPNGSLWTQGTQHHPSNWLGPGDDDEDDEDDEFVQTTPNY